MCVDLCSLLLEEIKRTSQAQVRSPGYHLSNHGGALVDLADHARKFVEGLVTGLNEGRYSLAVPVEWSESRVEHGLKVL